jgi:hypothetical protein
MIRYPLLSDRRSAVVSPATPALEKHDGLAAVTATISLLTHPITTTFICDIFETWRYLVFKQAIDLDFKVIVGRRVRKITVFGVNHVPRRRYIYLFVEPTHYMFAEPG